MTSVIIGAADQSVSADLRNRLSEIEDAEVVRYAETTSELSAVAGRDRPDVVFVHDLLGPDTAANCIREIVFRSPATAVLLIASIEDPQSAMAAFEAGAKGVVRFPFAYEDVVARFATAKEWASRMTGWIAGSQSDTDGELGRRGRITVVAGAKGGVGATTITTHLALDVRRRHEDLKVCLVDLDLQAGDVSGILEARQRVSIADVARVSEDLSARTVTDALVMHESGIALLLTPLEIHETDIVTPSSVRAILHLLRQEYDVILVDGGSHATPAQAAAVEVADELVAVVTPDVLSMRALKRTTNAWESLGVARQGEVNLVLNRVSANDVLTPDAVARLTGARLVETCLPAAFRRLEPGINARNPDLVRDSTWWTAVHRIGEDIGVVAAPVPQAPTTRSAARARTGARRNKSRREAGQVAIDTVALVPLVALICLLVWQIGLTSLAFVWTGHASNAAARAYSVGEDPTQAARAAVPEGMADEVSVSVAGDSVRVSVAVPLLCSGCAALPAKIQQETAVVMEP